MIDANVGQIPVESAPVVVVFRWPAVRFLETAEDTTHETTCEPIEGLAAIVTVGWRGIGRAMDLELAQVGIQVEQPPPGLLTFTT
ncbi:MAG: hypothetical protein KDD98_11310 [Sphingomonadaceae bacterium]|nr:hypothetical protein [Sphingomonadaceae bacterium]